MRALSPRRVKVFGQARGVSKISSLSCSYSGQAFIPRPWKRGKLFNCSKVWSSWRLSIYFSSGVVPPHFVNTSSWITNVITYCIKYLSYQTRKYLQAFKSSRNSMTVQQGFSSRPECTYKHRLFPFMWLIHLSDCYEFFH